MKEQNLPPNDADFFESSAQDWEQDLNDNLLTTYKANLKDDIQITLVFHKEVSETWTYVISTDKGRAQFSPYNTYYSSAQLAYITALEEIIITNL